VVEEQLRESLRQQSRTLSSNVDGSTNMANDLLTLYKTVLNGNIDMLKKKPSQHISTGITERSAAFTKTHDALLNKLAKLGSAVSTIRDARDLTGLPRVGARIRKSVSSSPAAISQDIMADLTTLKGLYLTEQRLNERLRAPDAWRARMISPSVSRHASFLG
jgi:hypothetical protein